MIRYFGLSIICLTFWNSCFTQDIIPFDTSNWNIQAQGYVIENYEGEAAIYIDRGLAILKDTEFLNGTIEFDIYLKDRRAFPGIRFRAYDDNNMESFYFRPHLSGKVDANQATPVFNGMSAWQLYFGPSYSFLYDYQFDRWTHVKLVVHNQQAQLFLDQAKEPTHSWTLKQSLKAGNIAIGGSQSPVHYANFSINPNQHQIVNFNQVLPEPIEGIIKDWEISDPFAETELNAIDKIPALIKARKWLGSVSVEENSAANISRLVPAPMPNANTVFAKVVIQSGKNQMKRLEFGYSDRVVAILNGEPIYKGTNQFRSRDYRYLGTIGLFDSIYLPLKKGENILLLAVSESFGGWGVMGRLVDKEAIKVIAP